MSPSQFENLGDIVRARLKSRSAEFQGWAENESYRDFYDRLHSDNPVLAKEFTKLLVGALVKSSDEESLARAGRKAAQMEVDGIAPVTKIERYYSARVRGEWNAEMAQGWAAVPAETRERFHLENFKARAEYPSVAKALAAARLWLDGQITFLTLFGLPGVGKTHLLLGVAWDLIDRASLVFYREERSLISTLQQAVGSNTLPQEMEELKTVPWLIIDDLGVSVTTDWSRSALDEIVDARWLNRMPLLVATNLKGKDLPPRLASRLGDMALGLVVQIDAPDYRRGAGPGA